MLILQKHKVKVSTKLQSKDKIFQIIKRYVGERGHLPKIINLKHMLEQQQTSSPRSASTNVVSNVLKSTSTNTSSTTIVNETDFREMYLTPNNQKGLNNIASSETTLTSPKDQQMEKITVRSMAVRTANLFPKNPTADDLKNNPPIQLNDGSQIIHTYVHKYYCLLPDGSINPDCNPKNCDNACGPLSVVPIAIANLTHKEPGVESNGDKVIQGTSTDYNGNVNKNQNVRVYKNPHQTHPTKKHTRANNWLQKEKQVREDITKTEQALKNKEIETDSDE